MDFENISSIIGTVGFPIAMCLMMFWYMKSNNDKHSEDIKGFMQNINDLSVQLKELVVKIDILISGGKNHE